MSAPISSSTPETRRHEVLSLVDTLLWHLPRLASRVAAASDEHLITCIKEHDFDTKLAPVNHLSCSSVT